MAECIDFASKAIITVKSVKYKKSLVFEVKKMLRNWSLKDCCLGHYRVFSVSAVQPDRQDDDISELLSLVRVENQETHLRRN